MAVAKGENPQADLERIKAEASFRGDVIEPNLKSILEHGGLAERAGIEDIDNLWTKEASKVHFTSTIRYPTFINGKLFNNQIDSLEHPELNKYVETCLAEELASVPADADIVALGQKGPRIVRHAAKAAGIDPRRVVALPHPSGSATGAVRDFPRFLLICFHLRSYISKCRVGSRRIICQELSGKESKAHDEEA